MLKLFCISCLPNRPTVIALAILGAFWMSSASVEATAAVDEIDPIELVGPIEDGGPAGFRFTNLNSRQVKALRQTVTLPLDALFSVGSKRDLLMKADVAPLPDPSTPFLPMEEGHAGDAATNPFDEAMNAQAGDALARLYASESGIDQSESEADAEDPFSDSDTDSDPFGAAEVPIEAEPVEEQDSADLEDDPFADF